MGRTGQARSTAVCRQMQDRTHKGGAVLWYLRKHAPMPVPYWSSSASKQNEEALGLDEGSSRSGRPRSKSPKTGQVRGRSEPWSAGPQRKFLHQTLLVIGSEIDEGQLEANTPNVHPQGSHLGKTTTSYQHRENLRKNYASHTDNEREQLEAAVRARELEVASLKKQVEEMEHYLDVTRSALASRSCRLQSKGRPQSGRPRRSVLPGASALLRTKKALMNNAGLQVTSAEDHGPAEVHRNQSTVMEEWQVTLMRQSEIAQTMRAHVDEQAKNLQQQTVQRKAVEAALFGTNAEILRLRAKTLETEARVQRLANELKRVYAHLPQMIEQRIASPAILQEKMKNKQRELDAVMAEHHNEFFKYMDNEKLRDESEVYMQSIAEMEQVADKAGRVLARGKHIAEGMVPHIKTLETALGALVDVWGKFASIGHPAGELCLKDSSSSTGSDDATGMLQRASLASASICELMDIVREDPIPMNPLRG